MLTTEHRHVILSKTKNQCADIYIKPTGSVQVVVNDQSETMLGEFHQLEIIQSNKKNRLSCQNKWALDLSQEDATELAMIIRQAEDEFEILMKDL